MRTLLDVVLLDVVVIASLTAQAEGSPVLLLPASTRSAGLGGAGAALVGGAGAVLDRKSTRLNSSHLVISYAVFCLKKKKTHIPYSAQGHQPAFVVATVRCIANLTDTAPESIGCACSATFKRLVHCHYPVYLKLGFA